MDTKLHTIRRDGGIYAAADRVNLSLKTAGQIAAQEQPIPGRKLLIWISPGWPYLTGPEVNISSRDQQNIFSNLVALASLLERARITLYSIDPLGIADAVSTRSTYYEEFLKGVPSASKVQQGNLALQVLVLHSGGKVLNTGSNIADEISSCIADASAFYVITVPRARADAPNTFHSIQVKLSDTKLQARTLFGYYAQP